MKKEKSKNNIFRKFVVPALSVCLAAGLVVGNVFAMEYKDLITTYFSKSDYQVGEEEKEKCEEVAAEGIVLLKNTDNALPLTSSEKKIAVLGQNSVDFIYGGSGSGLVNTTTAPTLRQSLERADFIVDDTVWNFYTTGAGKEYRKEISTTTAAINEVPLSAFTNDVKNAIKSNDVAVVSIGRGGGENADLPTEKLSTGYRYLQVDQNERDTLRLACESCEKVVLLVNANNPVELGFLDEPEFAKVKAVLWVGGVGQEGIFAIGNILNGTVDPSGRLADTYAYDSTSAPAMANFGDYTIANAKEQVKDYADHANKYLVYQEGIYVGYKYYETRYEDYVLNRNQAGNYIYSSTVQYPFGYGLSYTNFAWSDFKVEEKESSFEISVTVENKGAIAGKDVVEIYMQSPYTTYDMFYGVEKSAVDLVGYAKTGVIEKDASATVTVSVDKEVMRAYDYRNKKGYIVDAGDYFFTAAKDAHSAINNILDAKIADNDKIDASRMSGVGDKALTAVVTVADFDETTYRKSLVNTDVEITNRFDNIDINYYEANSCNYLSRSNWSKMPTTYKNGSLVANEKLISDLNFNRSDEVVNDASATMPVNGAKTNYTVKDAIGKDYNDPIWDKLVNQLSKDKMLEIVRCGGYKTVGADEIGLPATTDKDGPAGISGSLVGGVSCMAWPVETMFATTWNDQLIEEVGEMIGMESILADVAGWYAPGANIHRTPYCGRNFEYFSEDGFLTGKIGAAEMRGVRKMGVLAFMKHFIMNDQEVNRSGVAIFANEQSIREIYLRGFEVMTRESEATGLMVAMSRFGAGWTGANKGLMTDVLRNEWGFKGMALTDQASFASMYYQDIIAGVWAGTDCWLNTKASNWDLDSILPGATSNPTVMTNVHRAAKNVIYAVVNSNAVQEYNGMKVNTGDGTPLWLIGLYTLDVVVGALCVLGVISPFVFKGKKKD